MMRRIAWMVLVLGMLASLTWAQGQSSKSLESPSQAYTPLLQKGLFDPSRFSMAHSYSVMFASDGKHSTVQNLYINSSKYALTKNLSLNLDLGYRFNPLSTAKGNDKAFLPNADLRFTPNEHLLIQMSYHTLDPYYYGFPRSPLDR